MNDNNYQARLDVTALSLQSASSSTTAPFTNAHTGDTGMSESQNTKVASDSFVLEVAGHAQENHARGPYALSSYLCTCSLVCMGAFPIRHHYITNNMAQLRRVGAWSGRYAGVSLRSSNQFFPSRKCTRTICKAYGNPHQEGETVLKFHLATNWPGRKPLNCYVMLFFIQCQYL
jgi:phage-related minor tail protein